MEAALAEQRGSNQDVEYVMDCINEYSSMINFNYFFSSYPNL